MKSDPQQHIHFTERRSPRTAVASRATLSQSAWYSFEVKICDVSQCGFKAECLDPVRIGSLVALAVPGIGHVQAQVRWQIGHRMGGMFLDPISLTHCAWMAERTHPPGTLV